MGGKIVNNRLQAYNRLIRQSDEIYRQAVKNLGVPETAFWILYCLRADSENGEDITQSEMSKILSLPKQTLNSALKKLENEGVLELTAGVDKRSKYVHLTETGKALAKRTADELIKAENAAWAELSDADAEQVLTNMDEFNRCLAEYTKKF